MIFSIALVLMAVLYVMDMFNVFEHWSDEALSILAIVHVVCVGGMTFSIVGVALQYMP